MIIQGKEITQIAIVRTPSLGEKPGRLVTEDDKEVIAIISDDEEIIVKDGYEVRFN